MQFGKILHDQRLSQNITAQQMADSVGVSLRAYRFYEAGSREPNLETLVKIADTLGVTTDYLLGRCSHGECAGEY